MVWKAPAPAGVGDASGTEKREDWIANARLGDLDERRAATWQDVDSSNIKMLASNN